MTAFRVFGLRLPASCVVLSGAIACRGDNPQAVAQNHSSVPSVPARWGTEDPSVYYDAIPLAGAAIDLSDGELSSLVTELKKNGFIEDAAADELVVYFNGIERAVQLRVPSCQLVQPSELHDAKQSWMIDFLLCGDLQVEIMLHSSVAGDHGSDSPVSLFRNEGQLTFNKTLGWSGWYACFRVPKPADWGAWESGK